jgi:ABC-2 type transport system ATP-binding protein
MMNREKLRNENVWAAPAPIQVHDLRKTYPGGVEAVKGIDFEVQAGEVFGLLGPNGAGKSTTIGMLTTTVLPTSGTARVSGHDVLADPIGARRASAVVFQEAVVDKSLTGRRNLDIHARLWGLASVEAKTKTAEIVDSFGLAEIIDRPVASYSGGQRRRLEIARSLVSRPRVLFLDEPTVGLDPRIRYELLDVIGGLRDRDEMTIMLTTHYLDEAERLCDRIAIVHNGLIVALDSPGALLRALGEQIVELRVDRDVDAVLSFLQAHGTAGDDAFVVGSTVTVPLRGGSAGQVIDAVAEFGAHVTATTTRQPTLDDVYLRLTGNSLASLAGLAGLAGLAA